MGFQTPTDLNAYFLEAQEAKKNKDQASAGFDDALNKLNAKREEQGLKPVKEDLIEPQAQEDNKNDDKQPVGEDSSSGKDEVGAQKPEKVKTVGVKKTDLLAIAAKEGVEGFDENSKVKEIAEAINDKRQTEYENGNTSKTEES
jgi:hypothetical protein